MTTNRLLLVGSSMVFASACMFSHPKSMRDQANDQNAQYKKGLDQQGPVPDFAKRAVPDPQAQVVLEDLSKKGLAVAVPAGQRPPSFLKAYPIGAWGQEAINGHAVRARVMDVAVFYKGGESGWCRFERMQLDQKGEEGHYGPPSLTGFGGAAIGHSGKHVDCAEVDALPAQ